MRTIFENDLINMEATTTATGPTLNEQTTAIINTLSNEATNDTKVLVSLIKLLLDEVNKSELSSLKGLISPEESDRQLGQ